LIMVDDLFAVFLDSTCKYFIKSICIYVHKGNCSVILFSLLNLYVVCIIGLTVAL
jgi:membrane protein CcdC involved in cytochrome C biogenesis